MTTRAHPADDPQPPTPGGAALARPCLLCRTTGGARTSRLIPRPRRMRGLCKSCYDRETRHGRLSEWARVRRAGPRTLICAECGASFRPTRGRHRFCSKRCAGRARYAMDRTWRAMPPGLSPILRPDPSVPVWSGLVVTKYPATTWATACWTRRPRDPVAARLHDREATRRAA